MSKRQFFGTDGIRGPVGSSLLQPQFVLKLGWAVGKVLARAGESKALIGKDTRISGYMLESALESGLSAAGVDVLLLGPMPTPAIAYLTRSLRAQLGIVISASHNLYQDNGIKFFSSRGVKLDDDIELAIEEQLGKEMDVVDSALLGKARRVDDASARYIEFCKSKVPHEMELTGMKVVLDCAHGACYQVGPKVFSELGAEVIDMGVDPNGFNINDNCGATKPAILSTIVKAEKADIGIALDGDGDRLILVDHEGEIVDGDEALFIIAKRYLDMNVFYGGVVGTLMSNMGLEVALKDLGIDFIRTQVGDRYIAAELLKHNWILGGEASGHIICRDATTTGDGIISALKILAAMKATGRSLKELKQGMHKFPQSLKSVRLRDPRETMRSKIVQQAVNDATSELHGKGRVLVRASGTEPVIRVMVEAEDRLSVETVTNHLVQVVSEQGDLI